MTSVRSSGHPESEDEEDESGSKSEDENRSVSPTGAGVVLRHHQDVRHLLILKEMTQNLDLVGQDDTSRTIDLFAVTGTFYTFRGS